MRKRILALLCAILAVVLTACAGPGSPVLYVDETHEHVYGFWYDVKTLTCVSEGEQVRYCKVCLAEERQIVPIPAAVEERNHQIENGSCTACGYTPPASE
ncbi:MAG: hypothetical protein IJA78_00970 [Clostridia bacterium]|nr:hypothetical protein [Clostridia bacterium]